MTPEKLVEKRIEDVKRCLGEEDRRYLEAYIKSEVRKRADKRTAWESFWNGAGTYGFPVIIVGFVVVLIVCFFRFVHVDERHMKLEREYAEKVALIETEYEGKLSVLEQREALADERVMLVEKECVNKVVGITY